MEPKFFNKDGSLTKYSFKCGKVQEEGCVSMWMEHFCYTIQLRKEDGSVVRKETDSLKRARAHYRTFVTQACKTK